MSEKRYVSSGHDVTEQAALSDKQCPECGSTAVVEFPWWDDPPEAGGACIGTCYECEDCGWYDDE